MHRTTEVLATILEVHHKRCQFCWKHHPVDTHTATDWLDMTTSMLVQSQPLLNDVVDG